MKIKTLTLAVFLGSCLMQAPLWAALTLTEAQKEELYQRGTISTEKGHFEVSFLPGAENIGHEATLRRQEAENLMLDLVNKDAFWRDIVLERFHKGLGYIQEGIEKGVGSIPEDFKKTLAENSATDGSFGATAHKIKNWIGFFANVAEDGLRTIFEVPFGAVYSVVVPAGTILYRPVAAGTEAVLAGTLWPIVQFSWNGIAWELSKNNQQPKAGDMTVTFIPNHFDHEPSTPEEL